jgi:hypothetical protein
MPHPKGSIVYAPSNKFAFPRAYISQLLLHIAPTLTYTVSSGEITFLYSPIPDYRAYLKFKDEFWQSTSNSFTLDWIVEWNYQTFFPGGDETTFFLGVAYNFDSSNNKASIDLTTIDPTLHSTIPLPPYPRPYWTPLDT